MKLPHHCARFVLACVVAFGASGCFILPKKRMVEVDHPAVETSSGVVWQELLVGTGAPLQEGERASVDFVCRLENETPVDSSYERGTPVEFVLGQAQPAGWNDGCAGMREGGKRWMLVPAPLAYGEAGVPGLVPPNSPLIFEVELRDVIDSDSE